MRAQIEIRKTLCRLVNKRGARDPYKVHFVYRIHFLHENHED